MNTIIFGTMALSFIAKFIEIKLHKIIAEKNVIEDEQLIMGD